MMKPPGNLFSYAKMRGTHLEHIFLCETIESTCDYDLLHFSCYRQKVTDMYCVV